MNEGRVVVDVKLAWCGDAIAVRRFGAGEIARIGDGPRCFAYVPCDAPGGWPVVRVDGAAARLVVPPRGKGRVDRATGDVEEVPALVAATLRPGDRARVTLGDFQIDVAAVYGEVLPIKRRAIAFAPLAHVAIAAMVHGAALGLAAQSAAASELDVDASHADEMARAIVRAEERAAGHESEVSDMSGYAGGADIDGVRGDGRLLGGARGKGDEGRMGAPLAAPTVHGRFAVEPSISRSSKPALARSPSRAEAHETDLVGALAQSSPAPSNAWAEALVSHGVDPFATRGAMRGAEVGSALGDDGLGLSGTGEGGGGKTGGVGLGDKGPLGHGAGAEGPGSGGAGSPAMIGRGWWGGSGDSFGVGHGHRGHVSIGLRPAFEAVEGRLPPEIVQHIVRQNFGRFRACYERGLAANPGLAGSVRTRFVIEGDRVVSAEDGGSAIPDTTVRDCVVKAFVGIQFPRVSRVTVVYPINFSRE